MHSSRRTIIITLALLWSAVMLSFTFMQETPVGSVKGRIFAAETGVPIKGASVWLTLKQAREDYGNEIYAKSNAHGEYEFTNVPVGRYTIQASAQVHSLPRFGVTVREGDLKTLNMKLKPGQPILKLSTNQNVFTTKETPEITLHGFTKGSRIILSLYKVDPTKLPSDLGAPVIGMLISGESGITANTLKNNAAVILSQERVIDVKKRDCEGLYRQSIKLDGLAPGIYVMAATVDGIMSSGWVSKSDLSIITKECGRSLLVYAVRPDTGEPVPGAKVQVLEKVKTVASGSTDSSGLWMTDFP